ncbi:uncharacterized protein LOC142854109 [Microtus pennsylvanicus]|uniref:uncharacterized protein LOC142854109 n=1 Tax=Microtus pennsylvanicus TaxID=10058 RepID=UPI003F6D81BF
MKRFSLDKELNVFQPRRRTGRDPRPPAQRRRLSSSQRQGAAALFTSSVHRCPHRRPASLTLVSKCFCFSSLQLLPLAGGWNIHPPSLCPVDKDVRTSDIQHRGQLPAESPCPVLAGVAKGTLHTEGQDACLGMRSSHENQEELSGNCAFSKTTHSVSRASGLPCPLSVDNSMLICSSQPLQWPCFCALADRLFLVSFTQPSGSASSTQRGRLLQSEGFLNTSFMRAAQARHYGVSFYSAK